MGSFHTLVEIGNLNGAEFESVEALVDTSAVYSMLPDSLLRDSLGLTPMEEINFTLADGSTKILGVGEARFKIGDRERISQVVFGPEGRFLLGAVTLQSFGLIADTTHHRLIPAMELTL